MKHKKLNSGKKVIFCKGTKKIYYTPVEFG